MNRRGFLRNLGILVSAISVGLTVVKPQRKLKVTWTSEMDQDLKSFHTVGYKGSQFIEAGVVYAPYIPLYQTALFCEPKPVPLTKSRNLLQLG